MFKSECFSSFIKLYGNTQEASKCNKQQEVEYCEIDDLFSEVVGRKSIIINDDVGNKIQSAYILWTVEFETGVGMI